MTDDPWDIVNRLRRFVDEQRGYKNLQMHCLEAADEIERLRTRVAGLEQDLQRVEDREFYSYLDVVERADD